jgi:hypothetical protein
MTDDDRRLDKQRKLADLDELIRKQDADHEARLAEITAGTKEKTTMPDSILDETDADRLLLLDRLAERMPDLDLAEQVIEWTTLPDGHAALLVNGGGIDGGNGVYFANAGDDVHTVGSMAPAFPAVGCIVIRDGTRVLADVVLDPLEGQQQPDA